MFIFPPWPSVPSLEKERAEMSHLREENGGDTRWAKGRPELLSSSLYFLFPYVSPYIDHFYMWSFIWGLFIYLFESREVSVFWDILFYLYVRLMGSHLARAVQQWPNQSEGKWHTCLLGIDNGHGCSWERHAIHYHHGNRKTKTSGLDNGIDWNLR